jgi:hypothetical protein
VPFVIYGTDIDPIGVEEMGESSARSTGIFFDQGHRLLEMMILK